MCIQDVKAQVQKVVFNKKDLSPNRDTTEVETTTYTRSDWKTIDIDFLSSYYAQDGNNGAVTGGIGTEKLTDFTQKVSLSIPTSPKLKINIDGGYDYYTSESTDNINNIRSSDSISDVRSHINVGFTRQQNNQWTYGARLGTSVEYDYTSVTGGLNLSYLTNNGNSRFDLQGQAFYDVWGVIYPKELRGEVSVPTDKRQSYNIALTYSQVLNKRMQIALMSEVTLMNGLLSTPFHRVYFEDQAGADIERLPSKRYKIPIGARFNYHLSDRFILRTYYRYYWDNWGMDAHTFSVEVPYKINRFFAVYPHYRYHTQSAIDHFAGYKEHRTSETFYTSDYDLSDLSSHSIGLGILYSKPNGLARVKIPFVKNRKLALESIDLKGSYYTRSTGLKSYIISVGTKISF